MPIARIEMLMPSHGGPRTVSTSGKDFVIGGVGLTVEEAKAFHELIGELSMARSSILKVWHMACPLKGCGSIMKLLIASYCNSRALFLYSYRFKPF